MRRRWLQVIWLSSGLALFCAAGGRADEPSSDSDVTESATDPKNYERVVGRSPEEVANST